MKVSSGSFPGWYWCALTLGDTAFVLVFCCCWFCFCLLGGGYFFVFFFSFKQIFFVCLCSAVVGCMVSSVLGSHPTTAPSFPFTQSLSSLMVALTLFQIWISPIFTRTCSSSTVYILLEQICIIIVNTRLQRLKLLDLRPECSSWCWSCLFSLFWWFIFKIRSL